MTPQEAIKIRADFLGLAKLVKENLPQTIMVPDYWDEEELTEYKLHHIDLATLTATYIKYLGCDDYEYHYKGINLEELFKEQA